MSICLTTKKSNCKDCYKCIRNCPVKAIGFASNQAYINYKDCIICGRCVTFCPQNAKEVANDVERVKGLLQGDAPVIASISPAFIANYSVGISSMENALKKLGFFEVEETVVGAAMVKAEYEKTLCEKTSGIVISSVCHSVNLLIRKYFPENQKYLAQVVSPMQAHCTDIKRRYPDAKTVFIGPCIAAKDELQECGGAVDAAITFGELSALLGEANIKLSPESDIQKGAKERLMATSGGIIKSMEDKPQKFTYISLDRIEDCIAALCEIENNSVNNCFIEMWACEGGCIGSHAMEKKYASKPVEDYLKILNSASEDNLKIYNAQTDGIKKQFNKTLLKRATPSAKEIEKVLSQMGRVEKEKQLDCGICGYDTCRQKAEAVCQGKADISMCLPLLKGNNESFSNNIIKNFPDGIILLNESLEVCQINEAAKKILNIASASEVIGSEVMRILDPTVFINALENKRFARNERVYLDRYNKYVERTVIYDKASHLIIGIIRDVTDDENEREEKEKIGHMTAQTADEVLELHMNMVQQVASLLGETVAETKVKLSKLKESAADE